MASVYLAGTLVVPGSAFISLRLLNATTPGQGVPPVSRHRQEIVHETSDRGNRIACPNGDAIGSRRGNYRHDGSKADADV